MYKNIVVGFDGSDRALGAVEQAADLATALGSRLHLVTAVAKDDVYRVGASTDERFMSGVEIAEDRLSHVASNYTHLDLRARLPRARRCLAFVKQDFGSITGVSTGPIRLVSIVTAGL